MIPVGMIPKGMLHNILKYKALITIIFLVKGLFFS